jgi:DNA-binding response OmpR family regulator
MEELTLRIEAIMRRVHIKKQSDLDVFKMGGFTYEVKKQLLTLPSGEVKKLTTKESELLVLLYQHANDVLQRDFALKTIWVDDNYFNARSMDVYITKLRKHLKDDPNVEIINVHGKGYKLVVPSQEAPAEN